MTPVDTLSRAVEEARAAAVADGFPQFVQLVDPARPRYARTLVVGPAGVIVDTGWQSNVDHRVEMQAREVQHW